MTAGEMRATLINCVLVLAVSLIFTLSPGNCIDIVQHIRGFYFLVLLFPLYICQIRAVGLYYV